MAGELAKAVIETIVDLAGLEDGLKEAEGETNKGLASLGKTAAFALTGVVLGAVTVVTSAIAGIGAAAFDVANQFQGATSLMQAQLGLTADEAQALGDVVQEVYRNNFGESIEDVGAAVSETSRLLRDLGVTSEAEIQGVTESAFMLRDAFGLEVPESLSAAETLMANFGLTSEQAFDFLASGFQQGLDRSGDFLDTIGEYSTQFASGGADAAQFFSALTTGLQGGMLGTDKAADMFKEFRLRISEGGEEVAAALEEMSGRGEDLLGAVQRGELSIADAFDMIVSRIDDMEDPMQQQRLGIALMGSQFEDLGIEAATSISLASASLEDMAGATESLGVQYNTLGSFVEGLKRRFEVGLAPIGDVLLNLAQNIMPLVEQGFAWFEDTLLPVVTEVFAVIGDTVQSFFNNLEEGMSPLDSFIEAIWDIAPPEVLDFLIRMRDEILPQFFAFFDENIQPIIDMVTQFVSWKDILIVVGGVLAGVVIAAIIGLVQALAPIVLAVGAVIAVVALLRNAWENNWGGIQDKVQAVMAVVVPFIQNAIATITSVIQTALANIQAWWAANGANVIASVQNAFNTVLSVVQSVIATVQNIIQTALALIQGWWTQHGDSVMTIVNAAMTFIRDNITEVITNVQTIIQNVLTWINNFWDAHGATIIGIVLDMWAAIKNEIQSALDFIGGIVDAFALLVQGNWEGFLQTLWDTVSDRFEAIKESISLATDGIRDVISNLIQDAIAFFQNTDWAQLGRNIITGILNGLENARQSIMNWLIQLAEDIIGGIVDFFGGGGAQFAEFGGDAAGLSSPFGGFGSLPSIGGGDVTHTHYHLTVNSGQAAESIAQDFYMMQAVGA